MSVVINNYNYGRYVGSAIQSVLDQSVPAEVIVVDDGSTDCSREVIGCYRDEVTSIFTENRGQASCFNRGFEASSGRIVLFLDADDVLLPGAVEGVLALFGEGVVQAHWSLAEIDAAGRRSGRLKPERLVRDGCFLDVLARLGPRSVTNVPTSGNAWCREALSKVLPMPEAPYRLCADAYLHVLLPTYGATARSLVPLSGWRRHGENRYNARRDPLDQRIAEERSRIDLLAEALRGRLAELGIEAQKSAWERRNSALKRLERVRSSLGVIKTVVPEGGTVLLVDDGDWDDGFWDGGLLTATRPVRRLFDSGCVPSDATAHSLLAEFDRQASLGATCAVVVWPGGWILDEFPDLRAALENTYEPLHRAGSVSAYALDRAVTRRRKEARLPSRGEVPEPPGGEALIEARLTAVRESLAAVRRAMRREQWEGHLARCAGWTSTAGRPLESIPPPMSRPGTARGGGSGPVASPPRPSGSHPGHGGEPCPSPAVELEPAHVSTS